MAKAGEHHGDIVLVGGSDHLLVTHRATGLDHCGGAGLSQHVQAVAEGEEGVGGGITVTNREDGTVAAVRDRTGLASIAGTGRWFVREGRYCALLRWQSGPDSFGDGFCVAVHRVGDTYFGIRESDEPDARPIRLRIGGR